MLVVFLIMSRRIKLNGCGKCYSTGAQGGPVCKICPLILTLDPYWGPQGGLK